LTEFAPISSFNHKALKGFLLSLLAVLALCASLLPVPFTALVCYPSGLVLGIASLVLGYSGLREIRSDGKNGQSLALFATWMGGITMVAILCMATVGVLLYPYISESFQQVINQIRP